MIKKFSVLFMFLIASLFTSEYVHASDNISSKSNDMLSQNNVVVKISDQSAGEIYAVYDSNINSEQQEQESNAVKGDVIALIKYPDGVKNIDQLALKSDVFSQQMNAVAKSAGGQIVGIYDELSTTGQGIFTLIHSDTVPENEMLEKIENDSHVLGASLNYKLKLFNDDPEILEPNDPKFNDANLWGLKAIRAPEAWVRTTGNKDTYVAIIDSGIDFPHEDLTNNIEAWNYSKSFTGSTTAYDEHSHGTHVSGTIGATGDNSKGVAGINWKTNLIALKIFGASGSCNTTTIIDAIDYLIGVLNKNPDVKFTAVNMSLGGYQAKNPDQIISTKDPYYMAMKALNDTNRMLICVAAGNENFEVGKNNNAYNAYCYPASFKGLNNMIVVGSVEKNLNKSSFSNYSKEFVDIAAPGGSILSTIPNNKYAAMSGTSMATPHVTGAVNLLMSLYPKATTEQIKNAILNGANSKYMTSYTAHGLLDLMGAIEILDEEIFEDSAPVITSSKLPDGMLEEPYEFTFKANGTRPIDWEFVSGDLPDGLTFDESSAAISGTPNEAGDFEFTISAINSVDIDTKIFTLSISNGKPQILRTTLSDGSDPNSYTSYYSYYDTLIAKGVKPITWTLNEGEEDKLPPGLVLSSDGKISGFPYKHGTYKFNVTAENELGTDTAEITIKILGVRPMLIENYQIPSAVVGKSYSYQLTALGSQPITFKIEDLSSLPEGLTFDENTGIISGIPTKASESTYQFEAIALNDYGAYTQKLGLYVAEASDIEILNDTLPVLVLGEPYSFKLETSGTTPTKWAIEGNLNFFLGATSNIPLTITDSGTLTAPAIYNNSLLQGSTAIKITASNGNSKAVKYFAFSVTRKDQAQKINLDACKDGTVDKYYSQDFNLAIYTNTADIINGELPPGLKLVNVEPATNILSRPYVYGVPTKAGTYNFTFRAGYPGFKANTYVSKDFTIVINETGDNGNGNGSGNNNGGGGSVITDPKIETSSLPNGTTKIYYSTSIKASGSNLTWRIVSGDLPDGIGLRSNFLYGTPTKAGIYKFEIAAVNSKGADSKTFTLTINENQAPEIVTDVLPAGEKNISYSALLTANSSTDVTWSIYSGKLPTGLTLNANGAITGTPTEQGDYNFTVKAVNSYGSASKSFTIRIEAQKFDITLDDAYYLESYKVIFNENDFDNATTKTTWKISDGSLPKGIKITNKGKKCTLSGKPEEIGEFSFTVTATTPSTKVKKVVIPGSTVEKTIVLKVLDVEPALKSTSKITGTINKKLTKSINLKGACKILETSFNGLPDGITVATASSKKGVTGIKISGTPNVYGDFEIEVNLKNSRGIFIEKIPVTIKNVKPKITTSSLPTATAGQQYNIQLNATGDPEWSWSGKIPDGLNLNSDGTISGVPVMPETTKKNQKPTFKIKVTAKNSAGSVNKTYTLKLLPANDSAAPLEILAYDSDFNYNAQISEAGVSNSVHELETGIINNFEAGIKTHSGVEKNIDGEKYIVIAELPEISVNYSGQYDIMIELDEGVAIGEELFWFANPVEGDHISAEDNLIADFFNGDTGEEIFDVPENHLIIVAPWLNAGVIYKPVLAIKAQD